MLLAAALLLANCMSIIELDDELVGSDGRRRDATGINGIGAGGNEVAPDVGSVLVITIVGCGTGTGKSNDRRKGDDAAAR